MHDCLDSRFLGILVTRRFYEFIISDYAKMVIIDNSQRIIASIHQRLQLSGFHAYDVGTRIWLDEFVSGAYQRALCVARSRSSCRLVVLSSWRLGVLASLAHRPSTVDCKSKSELVNWSSLVESSYVTMYDAILGSAWRNAYFPIIICISVTARCTKPTNKGISRQSALESLRQYTYSYTRTTHLRIFVLPY